MLNVEMRTVKGFLSNLTSSSRSPMVGHITKVNAVKYDIFVES